MIKMVVDEHYQRNWMAGLLINIDSTHRQQRFATVLTNRGVETWPLDSFYQFEVISESR
jgi:hypothetical protein